MNGDQLTLDLDDFQLRMLCEVAAWYGTTPEACLDELIADWIRLTHGDEGSDTGWKKVPCDAPGARFTVSLDDGLLRMLREVAERRGETVVSCLASQTAEWLDFHHDGMESEKRDRSSLVQENGMTWWWVTDDIAARWGKHQAAEKERTYRYRPHVAGRWPYA